MSWSLIIHVETKLSLNQPSFTKVFINTKNLSSVVKRSCYCYKPEICICFNPKIFLFKFNADI